MPRNYHRHAVCAVLAAAVSAAAFAGPKEKPVVVVNDPSSPVPVEVTGTLPTVDTEVPALNAYQASVDVPFSTGISSGTPLAIASVPADQRLVIEHVSGRFAVQEGFFATLRVRTVLNGASVDHTIPVTLTGTSGTSGFGEIFQFSQPVTLYADAGTQPAFRILLITGSATGFASFSASGHFVDLMP